MIFSPLAQGVGVEELRDLVEVQPRDLASLGLPALEADRFFAGVAHLDHEQLALDDWVILRGGEEEEEEEDEDEDFA